MKLWSNGNVENSIGGFNPEKRLLAAVLQRAITDFVSGEGEPQESARDWLFSNDDLPDSFGFSYICEALDFHQGELCKAIQRQHLAFVEEQKQLLSQMPPPPVAVAQPQPQPTAQVRVAA